MTTLLAPPVADHRFDSVFGTSRGACHYETLMLALAHGDGGERALEELERLNAEGRDFESGPAADLLAAFAACLAHRRRAAWGEGSRLLLSAFGVPADDGDLDRLWDDARDWVSTSLSLDPTLYFDGTGFEWYEGWADGQLLAAVGGICGPVFAARPHEQVREVLGDAQYDSLVGFASSKGTTLDDVFSSMDQTSWASMWGNAITHYATDGVHPHNTNAQTLKSHLFNAILVGAIGGEFT